MFESAAAWPDWTTRRTSATRPSSPLTAPGPPLAPRFQRRSHGRSSTTRRFVRTASRSGPYWTGWLTWATCSAPCLARVSNCRRLLRSPRFRVEAAARTEAGEPLALHACDEGPAYSHENLVDMIEARPDRFTCRVRELHRGLLSARSAIDVAYLAAGGDSGSRRNNARGLVEQRSIRRRTRQAGRRKLVRPASLTQQHCIAVGVDDGYLTARLVLASGGGVVEPVR